MLGRCPGWSESLLGAQVIFVGFVVLQPSDEQKLKSLQLCWICLHILQISDFYKASPTTRDADNAFSTGWLLVPEQQFFSTMDYRKFPKYSDTQKICCNHSKILTMWLYHRVISPNDADRMANSVDPDQTAPLGAVWSGSALFAQAYLSENLGSLQYIP